MTPFWTDQDETRRYDHYVRAAASDTYPWELDERSDQQHAFASLAWRAGGGPVMSPPYIRSHHLVAGARVYRSSWDGALLATVTLATPPPAPLAKLGRWSGWPTETAGDHYVPVDPYEQQIGAAAGRGCRTCRSRRTLRTWPGSQPRMWTCWWLSSTASSGLRSRR